MLWQACFFCHATMAEPPDIAACQEAHHNGLVFLAAANGSRQRLLHHTTSENVLLPDVPGHTWQLAFSATGFGYITAVAHQQDAAMAEPPPPMWVNDVFKMSLWRGACGKGAVMIKPSTPGSGCPLRLCWLSDLLAMPVAHYTAWDVHLPPSPPGADPVHLCTMQCKVYKFQARRAGQSLFWELGKMAAKMGFAMEDKGWYHKRKNRWLQLLGNYGVSGEHMVNAHTSAAAALEDDITLHRPAWSTHAVLLIAASWGAFKASQQDKGKGMALLRSWVAVHASCCSFGLTPGTLPEPGQRSGLHVVTMSSGMLMPEPSLGCHSFAKESRLWPHEPEPAFLVIHRAMKSRVPWLAAAIVNGIALSIEDGFDEKAWPCEALGNADMDNSKVDPNLRAEVAAIGRQAYATTRVAAAMNQQVCSTGWLHAVVSALRLVTLALASDGARFPGMERLIMTAAMNLDTSICAPTGHRQPGIQPINPNCVHSVGPRGPSKNTFPEGVRQNLPNWFWERLL